jgi:hypothetical protein
MSIEHPELDAPRALQQAIARAGGNNPYGLPLWRLVLAQNCVVKRAGIFHDLGKGEQQIYQIIDGMRVARKLDDTVTIGLKEVPKYPVDGWIMERWFPPEAWGTPEQWHSHLGEAGMQIMASEYPSRGDYWLINGPFEHIPELSDLENSIAMHEHAMRNRPTNYMAYLKKVISDEESAREARREKMEKDLIYLRKNELVPVLKSTSLEAQRFRNQLQADCGLREHLGAVHDA